MCTVLPTKRKQRGDCHLSLMIGIAKEMGGSHNQSPFFLGFPFSSTFKYLRAWRADGGVIYHSSSHHLSLLACSWKGFPFSPSFLLFSRGGQSRVSFFILSSYTSCDRPLSPPLSPSLPPSLPLSLSLFPPHPPFSLSINLWSFNKLKWGFDSLP